MHHAGPSRAESAPVSWWLQGLHCGQTWRPARQLTWQGVGEGEGEEASGSGTAALSLLASSSWPSSALLLSIFLFHAWGGGVRRRLCWQGHCPLTCSTNLHVCTSSRLAGHIIKIGTECNKFGSSRNAGQQTVGTHSGQAAPHPSKLSYTRT